MHSSDSATPRALPKKPLVEAIFEFRWALRTTGDGAPPHDPGFQFLLGRYYDRMRGDYPHIEDLPTAQMPLELTPFSVRHRFRVGPERWPLTQIGPGILTVNDTAGYEWQDFQPRIKRAIESLFDAYPRDVSDFFPGLVQLRYLNAIPYEPAQRTPIQFLDQMLHTNIRLDGELFPEPGKAANPHRVNLSVSYLLEKPKGVGSIILANGSKDFQSHFVLQIAIQNETDVPDKAPTLDLWLSDAHDVIKGWFFSLCRGELIRSFEAANG